MNVKFQFAFPFQVVPNVYKNSFSRITQPDADEPENRITKQPEIKNS